MAVCLIISPGYPDNYATPVQSDMAAVKINYDGEYDDRLDIDVFQQVTPAPMASPDAEPAYPPTVEPEDAQAEEQIPGGIGPVEIDTDALIQQQLSDLNLQDIENQYGDSLDLKTITGKSFLEIVQELATGKSAYGVSDFFQYIITAFGWSSASNIAELMKLAVIAILCSVLNHMKGSFNKGGVSDMSYYACYLLIIVILMSSVYHSADTARNSVDTAAGITRTSFPVLMTLTTAAGGLVSGAQFSPVMAVLTGGMIEVCKNVILPLVLFSGTLKIISGITTRMNISKFADLANDCCKWIMGISFTVFLGVMAIQGLMSSTYDGVSMRTAKYAVDKFIPVVGGMLSDTVDTIVGCSVIVKNAVGTGTLLIMAIALISPLMQILLGIFQFKVLAALLEPVADNRIVNAIGGVANTLIMFFAVSAIISAMLFIALTLFLNLR